MARIIDRLAESFSSAWRLLSDTTNFLSRIGMLERYEVELREWRDALARGKRDPQVVRRVRDGVVILRTGLRELGYDLRLGSKDIALEGFRNDDALGEGFRRLVLGIGEKSLFWVAGEANHIELAKQLEALAVSRRHGEPYTPHFLWYRWRNNVLVLSGAASETAGLFEELKHYFPDHKDFMLRQLASL
jgi:hypothetical protein